MTSFKLPPLSYAISMVHGNVKLKFGGGGRGGQREEKQNVLQSEYHSVTTLMLPLDSQTAFVSHSH